MTTHELTAGTWLVTTKTSEHVLDLDARTVIRRDRADRNRARDDLRRDDDVVSFAPDQAVPIVVTVGQALFLSLDIRQDGVPTLRMTTPVVSVRAFADTTSPGTVEAV